MSKLLEASCVAGVVTVEGVPVETASILSEGVGPSDGIAILDEDTCTYIPKATPDLKTTLENLSSVLLNISTALTVLDGKPLGALPPSPAAAADIAQIVLVKAQIDLLKESMI